MSADKRQSSLSVSTFLLFAGLGSLGTVAHYVVLVACVQSLGADPVFASVLGCCVGAITNFFLSHHITFRSRAEITETAPRFFAVVASGIAVNWLTMWSLVDGLGVQYLVAQVLATGLILLMNYFANALWTFRGRRGS